jgi:pentatricopeptide repeat protein
MRKKKSKMEIAATPQSKTVGLSWCGHAAHNHIAFTTSTSTKFMSKFKYNNNNSLIISHQTTKKKNVDIILINYQTTKKKKKKKKSRCTCSDVLRLMDGLKLPIPDDMYALLVQECTLTADSVRAMELHTRITRSLKPPLPLLNRLLLMHLSCGLFDTARHLFDRMIRKDFLTWATMILAYAANADYYEAVNLFLNMQSQFTFLEFPTWLIVCVLQACLCTKNMGLGKQVHASLLKLGIANDLFLNSSLMEFYGKFDCLEGADFVFNQLPRHNTMTWTARIISSCREDHFHDVFTYFTEMGRAGIKKSTFTFSSVLRACGRIDDHGHCGRQVHANAIKLGLDADTYVQCSLIDMYGRSGLLPDAKLAFEMIDGNKRNTACWNAMVTSYMCNGFYVEAIKFLYQMKAAGVQPQESLLNQLRIACGANTIESRI